MNDLLFVGERRSPTAIKRNVHWQDEALAAVPLFEALRSIDIDPKECQFVNWFERGGKSVVRRHKGRVVGLGKKVQKALDAKSIKHRKMIHPAARGKIRLRSNYIAHVRDVLKGE